MVDSLRVTCFPEQASFNKEERFFVHPPEGNPDSYSVEIRRSRPTSIISDEEILAQVREYLNDTGTDLPLSQVVRVFVVTTDRTWRETLRRALTHLVIDEIEVATHSVDEKENENLLSQVTQLVRYLGKSVPVTLSIHSGL